MMVSTKTSLAVLAMMLCPCKRQPPCGKRALHGGGSLAGILHLPTRLTRRYKACSAKLAPKSGTMPTATRSYPDYDGAHASTQDGRRSQRLAG